MDNMKKIKEEIKDVIENYFERRKGIFLFLWERDTIKDLGDQISLWSSERNWDIKPGIIEKKTKKNNLDQFNIENFTVFEMVLEISKELVDKWYFNREGKNMIFDELSFSNYLESFSNCIEQFLLREMHNFSNPIDSLEKVVFHNAVVYLNYRLKANSLINLSKFTIVSDLATLNWAKVETYDNGKTVKEGIEEMNDIEKWSESSFKAENLEGDKPHIFCIPNNVKSLLLIEESSINIWFKNDRINLYWMGALEVNKNIM
ncbi:hypothetical protein LCGC14_1000460 [marine sediment metagenome]|uniref:Uncharacterized protein n=1 Tax=marine sediment metagenome TaxID=412755 RepID=A0A0F9NPP1_9ZZZZ